MKHYSVLLKEVIEGLNLKEDGIYVDGTLGLAGHSKEILKRIPKGKLYAFDADEEAIKIATKSLQEIGSNYKIFHSNFKNLKEKLAEEKINQVDGILLDLGVSSPQIVTDRRGFSFMHDGHLDMRMDTSKSLSAWHVVNQYEESKLIHIFYTYGEEERSKAIAKAIIKKRTEKTIDTTKELVNVVEGAVGAKYFYQKHPERKIFQAIRIEVNDELNNLETVLPIAISLLKKGGRLAIITFHSLEDRIVKNSFKKYSEIDEFVKGLPEIPEEYKPLIHLVTKKAILPSIKELEENSRSKSSKLRIIERN